MSSEEITPTALPRGGFVGGPQLKAYDDIEAAQKVVEAALPIEVTKPDAAAQARGVVVHFRHQGDGYEMVGDVGRGDVGLVVTRTEIQAAPPAGVTTRLLRTAPLAEVLNAVRAHEALEEARRQGTRAILGEEPAPGIFTKIQPEIPATSGRTAITDDLLRSVALAYMQETKPGKDRRAIQRLAVTFDRPEGTVRTWISRARKEGWLGPGAKGRMGAEPGVKLIQWLGSAMREASDISRAAAPLVKAYGGSTYGVVQDVVRAYDDPANLDVAHRIGIAPLEANVIAQVTYGRSLSAELAGRAADSGADADVVLEGLAADIRRIYTAKNDEVTSGEDSTA